MVGDALAALLARSRGDWNARFAQARLRYPDLDAQAFVRLLEGPIDALATASAAAVPQRAESIVAAAYDAALTLVGRKVVGAGDLGAAVEAAWTKVLPALVAHLAESPERVVRLVTHAVYNLATTPEARPAQWTDAMARLGPLAVDVAMLERLGQVLAWRAGLAHLRAPAIALADALPPSLAASAVQADDGFAWPHARARLLADPWDRLDGAPSRGLREVARVGAFRGFGGWFVMPPEVGVAGEHFVVRSGDDAWVLTADAFGATWHRASDAEVRASRDPHATRDEVSIRRNIVHQAGSELRLADLERIGGYAATATTLAVTSPDTYAVVLIALT